ncbi:circadian-associated transcriptional repressor-like [Denticeps clupeoides]|uniref:Circadian-associated transcriptional repressor-like n=1 Tax=Denticeps clupeoides TaxID=299321 RepID=A0AAY4AFB9_9TELE|nr:circadian-associated transcriptional repressor-like [Denticeps clupeoides]
MQSTGSTSSLPSNDSLSSSDSFLFSDTDPGEEDADVFLSEREISGGVQSSQSVYSLDGSGLDSPGSQWACDGFSEPERSEVTGGRSVSLSTSISSSTTSGAWSGAESSQSSEKTGQSEADQLFAQKCSELRGFVRPLLELLNGLKKGRFDKGLSSFQQSVAMDRIQRIVGVLQKPYLGEKYLNTLLQVEMMLKLWFPQVVPRATVTSAASGPSPYSNSNTAATPPHKHKDQLHMPVKKRRLSWSDTDSSSTPLPTAHKCYMVKDDVEQREEGGSRSGTSSTQPQRKSASKSHGVVQPRGRGHGSCVPEGEASSLRGIRWSEPSLTWVHTAPILSPPKSCPPHEGGSGKRGSFVVFAVPPATTRGSPAMQDSSISSTTPFSEPCQSPQQIGCQTKPAGDVPQTSEACTGQGRGQVSSPPIMRAEPLKVHSPVQT